MDALCSHGFGVSDKEAACVKAAAGAIARAIILLEAPNKRGAGFQTNKRIRGLQQLCITFSNPTNTTHGLTDVALNCLGLVLVCARRI
jgi:hypothetical protein